MKKRGTVQLCIGIAFIIAAIGIMIYNVYESMYAAQRSGDALQQIREKVMIMEEQDAGISADVISEYLLFPEKEMPVVRIDNHNYVGVLEIPDLELALPVLAGEWSYAKLKIAPCVYSGSIYQDNMVIAAHNYRSHFARIKNLEIGDNVMFTDCEGNVFEYSVGWIDILQKYDTEEMKLAEDWDLSLFTCTYGGKERYTIRCIKNI